MFDFANTGRPMIFYAWDLEEYRTDGRGFYFDYEETVPGPVVRSPTHLVDLLASPPDWAQWSDRYAIFRERFCSWEDGHAASRVVDRLLREWPGAS
jgi:CDP-glycerol glycerophosphotransferase